MWGKGSAIRPVPRWAVVEAQVLDAVERDLSRDEGGVDLDDAFGRFEATQPHLAARIGEVLGRPLDETALALGYFLSIAVWLAFDRAFGARVREVNEEALAATESALALEEELRAQNAREPLEIDDVVAQEQPGVLAFVHEHVEAALEGAASLPSPEALPRSAAMQRRAAPSEGASTGAETGEEESQELDVDVDDVHAVYRAVVVMTLALSHAVAPADDAPQSPEMLA